MRAAAVMLRPWPWNAACMLLDRQPVETADWHEDYPMPDTLDALAMLLAAYEVDGPLTTTPRWWVSQVLYDGQVVGDAGFHGPPAVDGPVEVEIGYGIVQECRGRGIATAACGQLLELAWRLGADTVLAGADADNHASRRVLERNGFHAGPDGTFAVGRPA